MSQHAAISRYSIARRTSEEPAAPVSSSTPVTAADTPAPTTDTAVRPPRRRRRKWLAAVITPAVVIGTTLAAHQAWTWTAERRVANLVETLRAKGEPVSVSHYIPQELPPERLNAAVDLRDAGEQLSSGIEAWQPFFNLSGVGLPLTAQERVLIKSALSAYGAPVKRVRGAMTQPSIEWVGVTSTNRRGPLAPWGTGRRGGGGVSGQRGLAQLLYHAALLAHEDRDDATAIARVEELLFLARATARRLVPQSQGSSLRHYQYASVALDQILPDLAIGQGPTDASPAQVRQVLAQLLETEVSRDAILDCLRIERARHLEAVLTNAEPTNKVGGGAGSIGPGTSITPYEPVLLLRAGPAFEQFMMRPVRIGRVQQAVERLNLAINSFSVPDLQEYMLAFPESSSPRRFDSSGNELGAEGEHAYTRVLTANLQQLGRDYYWSVAQRRTTAVALAVRLYRVERGAYPPVDAASALVPAYLPALPVDPLATSGETIVFIPDEKRPRVYSVGEDGIDDGGWPAEPFAARAEDLRMTDWVVDLVRQPRPVPPPSQVLVPR